MSDPKITVRLVGQQFNQGVKAFEPTLKPGREVLLVREPNNPYDRNAVEVYVRMGHVDRNNAALLADLFDEPGHGALTKEAPWVKAATLGDNGTSIITVSLAVPPAPIVGGPIPTGDPGDDEIPF